MTWQTNVPRGDLLPLNERPRFSGNWTYIQTEMRDDHYWNEEGNHDGHHKAVVLTDIGDTGIALTSGNPTSLPASTEGMIYVRPKTATEATGAQNSEPFFMINDGANNIISQFGFKCLCMWTGVGAGNPSQAQVLYYHNVALQAAGTPGVVRTGTGRYTITFATPLPSDTYLVFAGGMNNLGAGSTGIVNGGVRRDATRTTYMRTTDVQMEFQRGTTAFDGGTFWMAVVGG